MISVSKDEMAEFLASPLLAGIDDRSRLAIFRKLKLGRVTAGAALLSQGEPNHRLWFVPGGMVAIGRQRADGPDDLRATLSGPAIFGTTTFFRSTVPGASIRAVDDLVVWTLDREGHEALRREDPRAAEALALAIVIVLSERFEILDARIGELMVGHGEDHPRASEWAAFRSQLFEDSSP